MRAITGGPSPSRCPGVHFAPTGRPVVYNPHGLPAFSPVVGFSAWNLAGVVAPSHKGRTRDPLDVTTSATTGGRIRMTQARSGSAKDGANIGASSSALASSSAGGSGTGTGAGIALGTKRRRLVLNRELPTINWDRYELALYRRIEEREKAGLPLEGSNEVVAAEGEGESEEAERESTSGSWLDAGSDLNAAYFRRWDDPAVHQPMLQDRMLVAAWRDAMAAAPPGSLQGKTVLDVGCGLGLLSMLAAKAGAARVIAVDGSEGAVEAARRIIKANGLDDKITVVHGALEELSELPGGVQPGEVDVVVSNWMGAGLLAGGMINTLAHAVKTWLRPGGLVLPDHVSLWAVALEDRDALQEAKDSWSRVAGLDFTAALVQVIKHPRRDVLTRKSQLLSAPQRLAEWNTADLRPESVLDPVTGEYARCPLQLTVVRDERLFGLVLYWEARWTFGGALQGEDKSPVRFSTHPLGSNTHYQQLMIDFPRSMRVEADDEVAGEVVLRPGGTDPRDLELQVEAVARAPGAPEAAAGATVTATYRVSHLGP